MRSPNDIAVLDNRTHNSFVEPEAKHHSAVKIPETFTDKTQDAISSGNCIMGMTMKTRICVNPDTQVFLFIR